jgi:hypothetical protein
MDSRAAHPHHLSDRPRLPEDVRELCSDFRSGLKSALNDAFASLYIYGALAFPRPARWRVDVDFHVLVKRPLGNEERRNVTELHEALGRVSCLGEELDGHYILVDDAKRSVPPTSQAWEQLPDNAWALHRAHILAGRFIHLHGIDPREIVSPPTWTDLEVALDNELRFIETHPEFGAFGVLNACRLVHSFRTRDVVTSKYESAQWALGTLPAEWRGPIQASIRFYSWAASDEDLRVIEQRRPAMVAFVKDEIDRLRNAN